MVDIPEDIRSSQRTLEPRFTTVDNEATTFPQADVERGAPDAGTGEKSHAVRPAVVLVWRRRFQRCVNLSRATTQMPVTCCTLKGLGTVEADYQAIWACWECTVLKRLFRGAGVIY